MQTFKNPLGGRKVRKHDWSKKALRTIFNNVYDAVLILDLDGTTLIDFNDKVLAMFGVDHAQAATLSIADFSYRDNIPNQLSQLWEKVIAGEAQFFEWKARRPNDNTVFDIEVHLCRQALDGNEVVLATIRNITARKRMEEQLKYNSIHDCLTGLYNRAYFEEELHRLNTGREDPVSVVVCDIDGLKLVNDIMGHEAGDRLLKAAARVINSVFRGGDVVARLGGDEFAVLLPQTDLEMVTKIAGRIGKETMKYNATQPEAPLGLSVGYAIREDARIPLDEILRQADNNMYLEKRRSGGKIRNTIVQVIRRQLEERGLITREHTNRLQQLVTSLAAAIGLPAHTLTALSLLAQFHDLGKVGIPDHILSKPEPLTAEEYAEVRRHCEIGHHLARSVPDLVQIADWILKQYEWWNGSGYPLGLEGEQIPVECRILAVANAYLAMTSDRPYRKALSRPEAVAELRQYAGTQFDPELVEKFIPLWDNNSVN